MNEKRDPRSMADTFKVDSRSKFIGSPEYFRAQQDTKYKGEVGFGVRGIGTPGKTRKNRAKNARTIQNRIARAEAQRKKGK